ncbi:MAG: hypothetical protein Q4A05_07950 [Ruminococcus sp.]|nr:hypothetical protein [Ruminococcus sp.]
MSSNELRQAILAGEELRFSRRGREYLLYGWEQCDGYVLSLECGEELVWQSAPQARALCAEEFLGYLAENL